MARQGAVLLPALGRPATGSVPWLGKEDGDSEAGGDRACPEWARSTIPRRRKGGTTLFKAVNWWARLSVSPTHLHRAAEAS